MSKETISEKIDHLFSKINWGASALDARAINAMNTLKKDVEDLEQELSESINEQIRLERLLDEEG